MPEDRSEILRGVKMNKEKRESEEIPECCGAPIELFEGRPGSWFAHCSNCCDGTDEAPTREVAMEAWAMYCR